MEPGGMETRFHWAHGGTEECRRNRDCCHQEVVSANVSPAAIDVLLLRPDSNKILKVVLVYASTAASDDDEGEEF